MAHPRVAEVDDFDEDELMADDPDEMDPSAFDFSRPQAGTLGQTAQQQQQQQQQQQPSTSRDSPAPFPNPASISQLSDKERARLAREHHEKTKNYQCLYPIYFDASRTRAEGRRVSREAAVENPLAREIVDALSQVGKEKGVGFQIVFEPNKQHPRDWANPGRIRVLIKDQGRAVNRAVLSKHHLYNLVAAYLKDHPTQVNDPMKLKLHGMPPMDEPPPPPAVPRGMKINTILPLHSPALTGGGVSDNMFKDMMAGMGMDGLAGPGSPAAALTGAPAKEKKAKDKKKK